MAAGDQGVIANVKSDAMLTLSIKIKPRGGMKSLLLTRRDVRCHGEGALERRGTVIALDQRRSVGYIKGGECAAAQ